MIYDTIVINIPVNNLKFIFAEFKKIGIVCSADEDAIINNIKNNPRKYNSLLCFRIEHNKINGYDIESFYEYNFPNYTHVDFKQLIRRFKIKKLL